MVAHTLILTTPDVSITVENTVKWLKNFLFAVFSFAVTSGVPYRTGVRATRTAQQRSTVFLSPTPSAVHPEMPHLLTNSVTTEVHPESTLGLHATPGGGEHEQVRE
jgi:hypothetical protein